MIVAQNLIGKAIRSQFANYFPDPDKFRKQKEKSPYKKLSDWFGDGNTLDLLHDMKQVEFESILKQVPGLKELIDEFHKGQDAATKLFLMEFALHGMAEFSLLSKGFLTRGHQFKDILGGMFTLPKPGDEDDEDFDDEKLPGIR
jgi:magnesium chelatase subunit I